MLIFQGCSVCMCEYVCPFYFPMSLKFLTFHGGLVSVYFHTRPPVYSCPIYMKVIKITITAKKICMTLVSKCILQSVTSVTDISWYKKICNYSCMIPLQKGILLTNCIFFSCYFFYFLNFSFHWIIFENTISLDDAHRPHFYYTSLPFTNYSLHFYSQTEKRRMLVHKGFIHNSVYV